MILLDGSIVAYILLFMLLCALVRALEQDKHFMFALNAAVLVEVSNDSLLFLVYGP